MSLIPVRCFSCGNVIGNKFQRYVKMDTSTPALQEKALDLCRLKKDCCRALVLGQCAHLGRRQIMANSFRAEIKQPTKG